MADKKPKALELPKDAPKDLVGFIDCTVNTVTIKPGKLGWITGSPKATFAPGAKPGTFEITIDWTITSVTLPAQVKNGQLVVDSSKVPDLSAFIDGAGPKAVDDWVKGLNDWLKKHKKQLGPPVVKGGALTIVKEDAGAAVEQPKAGLKTKVAVGVGATLIGLGTGAVIADQTRGEATHPAGQEGVAVSIDEAPPPSGEAPPAETVIRLPAGPVDGQMSVTGARSFDTPIRFTHNGEELTLLVPGNAPFVGTIDDQAHFDVRNPDGSFVGQFAGSRFTADHVFGGEQFQAQGTIDRPVVTQQTGAQSIKVFTDLFAAGFAPPPSASAPVESSDGNGLATGLGIGLIVLGTGLAGMGLRNGERTCAEERAAVERAKAKADQAYRDAEVADAAFEAARASLASAKKPAELPPEPPMPVGDWPSIDVMDPVPEPKETTEYKRLEDAYDAADKNADRADDAYDAALDDLLEALQDLADCEDKPRPKKVPPEYKPKPTRTKETM